MVAGGKRNEIWLMRNERRVLENGVREIDYQINDQSWSSNNRQELAMRIEKGKSESNHVRSRLMDRLENYFGKLLVPQV